MHSFSTLALVAATLTASVNGIPLARSGKHQYLHAPRALAVEPEIVKLAPVMAQRNAPAVKLDLMGGTCGGSTGFGCASGFCCSKWGYCGTTELYCGDTSGITNSTSAETVAAAGWPGHGRPHSWGNAPPAQTPTPAADTDLPAYTPPTYSSPAETSSVAAPVTTSAAPEPATYDTPEPAPSSYVAPSSSEAAPAAPSSYVAPSSSEAAAASPSTYSAPQPSSGSSDGLGDSYKMYTGNGAPSAGWPAEDQWADFETLWADNVDTMGISCAQFGQQDNSDTETADIKSAIESVSASSGVPAQFILAVLMQESKGCVRVPTTAWSHENPGLFQSFQGTGTCNPDGTGVVPCPSDMITQMVKDGVEGTASGPGLKQNIAQSSASGAQKYYEAARIYNAGSLVGGNLGAAGATACYCSDVANRLTGWATTDSACTL